MFRRFTTPATAAPQVDELVAGALPDRVQIAHERLAHQDDPALLEALSERELAASRELAELVRDYERHEQRARIQAAAEAAERVRRTAAELAEREAADLLRAAQAIGEQRHSSSPHAKVARLHQRKPKVLGLLTGVVAFSMLFSAVTVQQNIAPSGGAANPMFWLSYGLEALISAVLVALMLSTGDTAEWGVIDRLWQIYTVEGVLLTASIALNTFPYWKSGDVTGIGIHSIAPVMIGVALVTHRLVAERYGRAIEQATAAVPDHEDLQARLAALTQVGGAANQILPGVLVEKPTLTRRTAEQSADSTQPPEGSGQGSVDQERAVARPADAARAEASATAGISGPDATAPDQDDPEADTAPIPVTEPADGAESSAGSGAGEPDLDARLASAVRQTLSRIRMVRQVPGQAGQPVEGPAAAGHVPEPNAPVTGVAAFLSRRPVALSATGPAGMPQSPAVRPDVPAAAGDAPGPVPAPADGRAASFGPLSSQPAPVPSTEAPVPPREHTARGGYETASVNSVVAPGAIDNQSPAGQDASLAPEAAGAPPHAVGEPESRVSDRRSQLV